jgi:hypothetical protein
MSVNSSLDAHRQIVVAARGQTISVATYPQSGLVLWGSEQAACKAAINFLGEKYAKVASSPQQMSRAEDAPAEPPLSDAGNDQDYFTKIVLYPPVI